MLVGPGRKLRERLLDSGPLSLLEAPSVAFVCLSSCFPLLSHPTLPGVTTGKGLMCILLSISILIKDIVGLCANFYSVVQK